MKPTENDFFFHIKFLIYQILDNFLSVLRRRCYEKELCKFQWFSYCTLHTVALQCRKQCYSESDIANDEVKFFRDKLYIIIIINKPSLTKASQSKIHSLAFQKF